MTKLKNIKGQIEKYEILRDKGLGTLYTEGKLNAFHEAIELINELIIPIVSQQRELLRAFSDWAFKQDNNFAVADSDIERYLNP